MSMKTKEIGMKQEQLLRIRQVLEIVPVSKSTWWKWTSTGKAPAPIRLGRCTCWRYADVIAFVQEGENER